MSHNTNVISNYKSLEAILVKIFIMSKVRNYCSYSYINKLVLWRFCSAAVALYSNTDYQHYTSLEQWQIIESTISPVSRGKI